MSLQPSDNTFFTEVRQILDQARTRVAQTINSAMVEAYWQIGKRIVEEEQGGSAQAAYEKETVKLLSRYLSEEFGKGFSVANLWNMRQFYLTYDNEDFLYALRRELSWTHHRTIMRIEDPKARLYYLDACSKENWSSRVLQRQIKVQTYQRILSTQQDSTAEPEKNKLTTQNSAFNILKDPYVLEFLDFPEDPSIQEKELETPKFCYQDIKPRYVSLLYRLTPHLGKHLRIH